MLTSIQNRRATPGKRCKWNLFGWFSLRRTWRNSCSCNCEKRQGYKIKFQLLTNIYVLPDKSGIKTFRKVRSAK